jgi:hypothetical protein
MNKDLILKNYIEWLRGTKQASEGLANNGLDIAKSANQADFKNCMFDGVKHEWVADEVCIVTGNYLRCRF